MKRVFVLLMLCLMIACPAAADGSAVDLLKPIWLNALEQAKRDQAGEQVKRTGEVYVTCADDRFEIVRSAVYMEDDYSTEAYVYAEIRNATEEVQRINMAGLTVRDGGGTRLHKDEYITYMPDVVMPGETFYISEWLYDFVPSLDRVHEMSLEIETAEYASKWLEHLDGTVNAEAWMEGGELYIRVKNASQEPVYDVGVITVLSDAEGKIRDIFWDMVGMNTAIDVGSALLYRHTPEQHMSGAAMTDSVCEAFAYRISY